MMGARADNARCRTRKEVSMVSRNPQGWTCPILRAAPPRAASTRAGRFPPPLAVSPRPSCR
jgi:hypothetical protein